jgi:hypothetical protein
MIKENIIYLGLLRSFAMMCRKNIVNAQTFLINTQFVRKELNLD